MLFLPNQQELDCISNSGIKLGKIRFDYSECSHVFYSDDSSISLSDTEKSIIAEKLLGLNFGQQSIPLQDDD